MQKIKFFVLLFVMTAFITGCEAAPVSLNKIKDDMNVSTLTVDYKTYSSVEIESLDVTRRRTEDGVDEIYSNFTLSAGDYKIEGEYNCTYEYYDQGGWILENSYMTDVKISIVTDEIPDIIAQEMNRQDIFCNQKSFDVKNVVCNKVGGSEYEILYEIIRDKKYCCESGLFKRTYYLEQNGEWTYYWNVDEEMVELNRTWDIVGTYYGSGKNRECELVIDSYNPETNEVHISYVKYYESILFSYYNKEGYDITASTMLHEPMLAKDDVILGMWFYIDDEDRKKGKSIRFNFHMDKVSNEIMSIERIE